jgi:type IV secretory pathway VirB2 component (pilin)
MTLARRLAHRLAAAALATSTLIAPLAAQPGGGAPAAPMRIEPDQTFADVVATVAGMVGDETLNSLVAATSSTWSTSCGRTPAAGRAARSAPTSAT